MQLIREVIYSGFRLSVAHFTSETAELDALTGHNLELTIAFLVGENSYLSDLFKWLEDLTKFIDHRTLIALYQAGVTIKELDGENLEISWLDYSIRLPKNEVCILPLENTHPLTLLRHIGEKILNEWQEPISPHNITLQAQDLPYRSYKVSIT